MIKQAEWKLEKAKEYLKQYKVLMAEKANLIAEERQILYEIAMPGSVDYSADRVQSSPDDQMLAKYLKLESRTAEVEKRIGEITQRMDTIKFEVNTMDDAIFKRVLHMRYIEFQQWEVICDWLNDNFKPITHEPYNMNYVRGKLHDTALRAFIYYKNGNKR